MKDKGSRKQSTTKDQQLTFRMPKAEYERLLKLLGPHVNLSSVIREQVKKYMQQELTKHQAV